MNPHVWLVLLAGGVGSRFWPMSRAARPKQLLDLFGDGPMLRTTLARALPLAAPERTIVVTSATLADEVAAMLPEVPRAHILAEPSGRNTAPAIAWAALVARAADPEAVIAVLPADHHIPDPAAFRAAAEVAIAAAAGADGGALVTLGVAPTRPDTGFGYIQRGEARGDGTCDVRRFVEKPDLARATEYLASGDYAWNAGMFFMPAALFLAELARHAPSLGEPFARLGAAGDTASAVNAAVLAAWDGLPSISIDYAVMEKSDRVRVAPATFAWSDVGAWPALMDHRAPEATSFHRGEVVELDAGDNVLVADRGVVAVVGLRGVTVVHTPDATLVLPTAEAQRVREVVAALKERGLGGML
jgi:mannose-1-phosphate guanylyltransferase